MISQAQRTAQLVNDEEEDTDAYGDSGAVPRTVILDPTTDQRCSLCGRPPGVVSAPGVDRFDLGVMHALNRLGCLLQKYGATRDEADAIVERLRAADVELP